MDLRQVEKAAILFYQMCAMHPEICPHDYEWSWSKHVDGGKEEHHDICRICGDERVVTTHLEVNECD